MKLPNENDIAFKVEVGNIGITEKVAYIVQKGKKSVYERYEYRGKHFHELKRYSSEEQAIQAIKFRIENGHFPTKKELES